MPVNTIMAIVATLMALLSAAAAVGFTLSAFADAERTRASAGWPAVEGAVVASSVETFWSDTAGTTYIPSITYSYTVEGRQFEGADVRIGGLITTSDVAEQIVRAHPPGARVPVFVDPFDPARAVLQPALPGTFINRPLFALGSGLVLWTSEFFALVSISSRSTPPALGLGVSLGLILASLVCMAGGARLMLVHRGRRHAETADRWPTADGIVTESTVLPVSAMSGGPFAIPRIAYRYTADGRERAGHRLSQGPALMTMEEAAAVAARYPIGSPVVVYRSPVHSTETVIDPTAPPGFQAYAVVCGLGLMTIGAIAILAPCIVLAYRLLA